MPDPPRRTLFHPREAAQARTDAPAQAGPLPEGLGPSDPPVAPMETDPEPVHVDMQGDSQVAPLPVTGPMEKDESSTECPAMPPSQHSTPDRGPGP